LTDGCRLGAIGGNVRRGVSDAEAATGASAPAARQGRQRWAVLTESLILTPDPRRKRLRALRRWVFFLEPSRRASSGRGHKRTRTGGSSGSSESEGEWLSSAVSDHHSCKHSAEIMQVVCPAVIKSAGNDRFKLKSWYLLSRARRPLRSKLRCRRVQKVCNYRRQPSGRGDPRTSFNSGTEVPEVVALATTCASSPRRSQSLAEATRAQLWPQKSPYGSFWGHKLLECGHGPQRAVHHSHI